MKVKIIYSLLVYFFCCVLYSQNNIHYIRAKQFFSIQNFADVIEEINLSFKEKPNFDSALYLKAYSEIKLNLLKEASISIKQLQKTNSDYSDLYFLKGLIFALKEKYPDAIINFNKVLNSNPRHEKALYNLALSKGLLEDYAGAIKDLDKCLAINPHYALAFYNRGYWYELLEKYDLAINDYLQAITIDKHYSEAYLALTYVYSQKGDVTHACETLQKAKTEGVASADDLIENFCK